MLYFRCLTVFQSAPVCYINSFCSCCYRLKTFSLCACSHAKFGIIHIFTALITSVHQYLHSHHNTTLLPWLFFLKEMVSLLVLFYQSCQVIIYGEFDNLWICLPVCDDTQLPWRLQRTVILPVLEESAGLWIDVRERCDSFDVRLWVLGIIFDYCLRGLKAAAPVVVPNAAADSAAAPVSTLSRSWIQFFFFHMLITVPWTLRS